MLRLTASFCIGVCEVMKMKQLERLATKGIWKEKQDTNTITKAQIGQGNNNK